MKNIRVFFKNLWKLWMYFCTALVSLAGTMLVIFCIITFTLLGNPYIDSCLDLGGRWNDQIHDCEGSPAYNAWKERTWW